MRNPENPVPRHYGPKIPTIISRLPIVVIMAGRDGLQEEYFEVINSLFKMPMLDEVKEPLNNTQQKRYNLVIDLFRESLRHPNFIPITKELIYPNLPKVQDGLEKTGYCLCLLALGGSTYGSRYSYEKHMANYKQQLIEIAKKIKIKPELLTPEHLWQAILSGWFNPLPFKAQLSFNKEFGYDPFRFLATAPFYIIANAEGVARHHYRSERNFEQIFEPVKDIKAKLQINKKRERFDKAVNLLRKSVESPDFNQALKDLGKIDDVLDYEEKVSAQLLMLLSLGFSVINKNNYVHNLLNYRRQINKLNQELGRRENSILPIEILSQSILSGKINLISDRPLKK